MNTKAVMILLRLVSNQKTTDERNVHVLMAVLAGALAGMVLLSAIIINILTLPFELDGVLGEFQRTYSYLVTDKNQSSIGQGGLSDAEIDALMLTVETSDPKRLQVIREALSLVGRVPYFWGGKSAAGWNEDWNSPKLVSAPGSSSSGTIRPYGLDCSGFTDWAFRTAGLPSIGDGTYTQYWSCSAIQAEEMIPGDLIFKNNPSSPGVNHVGIYFGPSPDTGKPLFIHCSSGGGGVVLDGYSGFRYPRRPIIFD